MDLGKCTFEIGGHQGYIGTPNITEDRLTQSLAKDSNTPIDCIWTISVKEDYQIFIKFAEPQLAYPNDCHLNYLQVRKNIIHELDLLQLGPLVCQELNL